MNDISYSSIIPLIGGMCFGAEKVLHKLPEYILSYKPFSQNDNLYLNYHDTTGNNVHYMNINEDDSLNPKYVDIVVTLCPCAGLSQLNSAKSRGSNAPQNEWMYKSSEYVLSKIAPKVLIGENAPALYDGKHGKVVLDILNTIAIKYDYSFSVVKTNSLLHGVPQNRKRSFYYFWKSDTCPILNYTNVKSTLSEYLSNSKFDKSLDVKQAPLIGNPEYKFLTYKLGTDWRKIADKTSLKSLLQLIQINYSLQEYIAYLKGIYYDENYIDKIIYVDNKLKAGLNFRDWTPYVTFDNTASLTGARTEAIHPTEDRLLTYKELMYLMGLPDDMQVPADRDIPKLFQNVPSNTAAYWINEAIEVIKGNRQYSNKSFMKQNNVKQIEE